MSCFNYVYNGFMMQFHHGRWVGTSCLFIGGRKPTNVGFLFIGGRKPINVGFLFIGGRKPTYVGFLLDSTRRDHLIPGAVIFSIWRSRIFQSKFFSLKNLVSRTINAESSLATGTRLFSTPTNIQG